jgi:hypothetical protein
MKNNNFIPASWQYFLLGILLWVFVDFGTAGGFRLAYFQEYGAALLLFYLGFPLIFTLLIFRLNWNEPRLFFATLIAIFMVEVLFTRNPLVMSYPSFLWGIPLAILVYLPLTYFPLWIVRKEMGKHRFLVIGLSLVEVLVMLLTTFSATSSY